MVERDLFANGRNVGRERKGGAYLEASGHPFARQVIPELTQ
jgi:hypothetical protein